MKRKLLPVLLAIFAVFAAGCSKSGSAKVTDPVQGKTFAFTEMIGGIPASLTVEFGMNSEVRIIQIFYLPLESVGLEDSVQRVDGTYVYDDATKSVFVHSDSEDAVADYQVVFTYDAAGKMLWQVGDDGSYLGLQEVENE